MRQKAVLRCQVSDRETSARESPGKCRDIPIVVEMRGYPYSCDKYGGNLIAGQVATGIEVA